MPVPLKTAASPATASIAQSNAPATSGASPGGTIDFTALLANINALAAAVLPSKAAPSVSTPDTTQVPELAELFEPTEDGDSQLDSKDDATDDDELLAALALAGLPIPAPQPAATAQSDKEQSVGDTLIESLGGDKAATPSLPQGAAQSDTAMADLVARLAPPASAQSLQAADSLLKADDASASATSASTNSTSNALPTQLHTLAAHAQTALDPAPRELRAPVGTHAWTRQLGDEIAWMMQQGRDAASLKLSPEHLGPLEVRISTGDAGTNVWFGAAHADTRAALEQTLPRLREMFASQGLVLADAGVFKEAPRQQGRAAVPNARSSVIDSTAEASPASRSTLSELRLLDTYV